MWLLDIAVPALFGLIGFFEPCSMGANAVFLARTCRLPVRKRIAQGIQFLIVRALVLSLFGLLAAVIGRAFFKVQSGIFLIIGVFYIVLGIATLYCKHKGIALPTVQFFRIATQQKLGLAFGLVIPACAIPLIIALLSQTSLMGNAIMGFVSLLVFGVFLSLPLVFLVALKHPEKLLRKAAVYLQKTAWLGGAFLIIVGILTILSSVWWLKNSIAP